eukprot:27199_1
MSTSNVQWKVGQRVAVFTSSTTIPQWVTGEIVYEASKKVYIQFDEHWKPSIYIKRKWFHKNTDNKIVIKHLNQKLVKYCTLPTCNSNIFDRESWKKGEKVEIYSNCYRKWCSGKILAIDTEGEFLECSYTVSHGIKFCKIDRYSLQIQPISSSKSEYYSICHIVTIPNPINEIHKINKSDLTCTHKKWNGKT